jgi:iron-sulfur cluster repair protein YtfE (RIC family)
MLVQLRRSPMMQSPEDVLDMLFDCHDRIRAFVRLASRLPDAAGATIGDIAGAAESLRRYFTVAMPLHVADEDLSIRPRLHEVSLPQEVRDALAAMSEQHAEIEQMLAALVPMWGSLSRRPARLAFVAASLRERTAALGAALEEHLRVEEETVFPAMRRYLSNESEEVIFREMRARRSHQPQLEAALVAAEVAN